MSKDVPTTLDPWSEQFVMRLRMHGVRGSAIGDALQVTQTHCSESGETPQAAFGDPTQYADSLATTLPSTALTPSPTALQAAGLTGGTGVAAIALITGASGLAAGGLTEGCAVSSGDLLQVALLTAGGAVIPSLFRARTGRLGSRSVAATFVVLLVIAVALPQLPSVATGTAFTAPAWSLLTLAVIAAVATWVPVLRNGRLRDPVIDPVSGTDRIASRRWARLALWSPAALLLVALWVAAALAPR